jgi:polar amino acid transport system substrate-binding protein
MDVWSYGRLIAVIVVMACPVGLLRPVPSRAAEPQPVLTLLTEENHPLNYTDSKTGEVVGSMTAVVRQAMELAKVSYTIRMLPWSRGMALAQTQADTCIFGINPTDERKPLFVWIGPFLQGGWALFARGDWTHPVADLAAARPFRIAAQSDSAIERYLKNQPGLSVEPTANVNVYRMLKAGRVDLVADGIVAGPMRAAEAGVGVRRVLLIQRTELAMACHPQTDPKAIARLRDALEQMRRTGALNLPLG